MSGAFVMEQYSISLVMHDVRIHNHHRLVARTSISSNLADGRAASELPFFKIINVHSLHDIIK